MSKALFSKFVKKYAESRKPQGRSDNGGRWYPSDDERCECCDGVREPSRSYPWSYYKDCFTLRHVKGLLAKRGISCYEDLALHLNGPDKHLTSLIKEVLCAQEVLV